jgi:MFS family permease
MAKLIVLMVTAFVDMVGFAMVIPLVPFYATAMGADATIVGILISAFSIAQLLSAPTWGRLSDRYGRRPAVLAGLAVSAAGYIVFAVAGNIWLLFLSRVVQGVGGGTVGVLQAYVADASDPEDRARGLGWLSAATSAGAVVGPAFGSLFVLWWGHAGPGVGATAFCVLSGIFAWRFLKEAVGQATAEHRARRSLEGGEGRAVLRVITHTREPASRLIWIYAIAIGGFYGTVPLLALLLSDRLGVTERNIGYFVMYLGAMGVLVRAGVLGWAVRRLGEPRLARLGLILLAAGLATVSQAHTLSTMAISLTLMPLGTAFTFPCITALLSRVVTRDERGLYMGVQQTFGGVMRVVFPIGTGWMADHFGMGTPWAIAAALVAGALFFTTSLESYSPATSPASALSEPGRRER